jgi:hypothetical protein
MPLIQLIGALIVVGLLLWLVNSILPLDATIKRIINVVVFVAVILWLLSVFGLLPAMSTIHVGRVR